MNDWSFEYQILLADKTKKFSYEKHQIAIAKAEPDAEVDQDIIAIIEKIFAYC